MRIFFEFLSGDFAYKNYLTHQAKHHQGEEILDKKTFLRQRQKLKWRGVNRCC